MRDVLLSNAGVQVYIIDGSRRTDGAARAVITALYKAGRICKEAAERAWSDRATLDKIKRNMLHVQMEERETETGKRWTFYTAGFVYMDIPAYSRNYIRADKQGNLYPAEAPTAEEPSTTGQDTACTDREPQEGTETAQKTTDMATFCAAYRAAYTALYDHCGEPETDKKERYYSTLFDQEAEAIADTVRRFCVYRGDLLTSDREAAAFMIALETVGAPTDGETATDGETTTTPETEPQRAAESAKKTADDTTPTAGDTEPPRATERATDAAGGSVSQSDRTTRPAAPQSHGTTKGIQRHHRPPKTAYRAIQRAAPIHRRRVTTSHQDWRKVTFSAWMYKTGSDPPKI